MRTLFLLLISCLFSGSVLARNVKISSYGYWDLCKTADGTNYIISYPIKEDHSVCRQNLPYLMVTSFASKPPEIAVSAGYTYKKDAAVSAVIFLSKVDASRVKKMSMLSSGEIAWNRNGKADNEMIDNFKIGSKVAVSSESANQAKTTDVYSLVGFTEAYNMMQAKAS